MKKYKYIYILGLIATAMLYGCTKDFEEKNINPSSATPSTVEPSNLLTYLEKWGSFGNADLHERIQNLYVDQFAQYYMDTWFTSNNYVMNDAWQEDYWPQLYQWLYSAKLIIANDDPAKVDVVQMARIWKVFMFHRATDLFGDIPYLNAGLGAGVAPAYDKQSAIYADMLAELKDASQKLNPDFVYAALKNNDIIYNGDIAMWKKFANSLLLRLSVRISLVDPANAKAYAEWAVNPANGGVFETGDKYPGVPSSTTEWGQQYPIPMYVSWGDLTLTQSMYQILAGLGGITDTAYFVGAGDPRGTKYFTTVQTTSVEDTTAKYLGKFRYMRAGMTTDQLAEKASGMADFSRPNVETFTADRALCLFPINESYFLRAEGAARGWAMGGTAQSFYEAGIKCSMKDYAIDDATITAYLASTSNNLNGVSVAWADNSVTLDQQLDKIITQKYLGGFPDNSFEAWADMRRLSKPYIVPVQDCKPVTTGITPYPFDGSTPTQANYIQRINYPQQEALTDEVEYNKVKDIDKVTTPVWWTNRAN